MSRDDAVADRDSDDVHTALADAVGDENIAAERVRLERAVAIAGRDVLAAVDELLRSPFPDPMEAAVLVARLTDHIEERQAQAISRLVVDAGVPAVRVAERLGWSAAKVAFACKVRRR